MRLFLRGLLALFLVLTAGLLPARAQDEGARVILVLDASGSMWGQIDGKPKIQIAKEVVAKVVGNWKEQDELGLVAYGHREKGSCEDIQVLIEPGKLDKDAYIKTVNGLNAKGKTPMTAAVKMAAESLKFTEKKATVILVSDGIETCGVDPCSVAAELEKLGVALTVHTVGFNVDDPAAKDQLKCMAENTGGDSVTAENAEELEDKLTDTIEKTEVEDPPPPPPPPAPEFNVTGHVTMAEGVELQEPFLSAAWEFHKLNADGNKGDWVFTDYGTSIKAKLAPMDYFVTVSADAARLSFTQTVGSEPVVLEPSLEAGIVRFSGRLDEKTELDSASAAWEVRRASDSEWVKTDYGPKPIMLVSAGTYIAKLSVGQAMVEQEVVVAAGKVHDVVMTLGSGFLVASAQYGPNGPPVDSGLAIEIRKPEANADGEFQWIATEYNAESRFSLPAGKYRVVVNRDYATGFAEGEVKAGQEAKVLVTLNAGILSVKAPANTSRIEVRDAKPNIEGQKKWIATEYTIELQKAFNAGSYEVTAFGDGESVLGTKTFEVKAGERTEGSIP